MAALVGVGGGLYLLGQAAHNPHQLEAGYLIGEAAIDAYAASTAMQYMTQRERPFTGNGKGQFFYGGNSFPSNTAAVSWAAASVLAREYPGTFTKLFAYGVAAGVSAGRVIGDKHWTSDAVIGSALGWYMGRQIYRARSQGPEINASNWGTFEREPKAEGYNPAYMGTTFVPLDSWVYPAFERLAALGYLPTEIIAIRPWPRLECARLVVEAEEQLQASEGENSSVRQIVKALRQEFAIELRARIHRFDRSLRPCARSLPSNSQIWGVPAISESNWSQPTLAPPRSGACPCATATTLRKPFMTILADPTARDSTL